MSGEDQDKTEQASPHKLREARKKGQIAKSPELGHIVLLLSGLVLSSALFPGIQGRLSALSLNLLRTGPGISWEPSALGKWLTTIMIQLAQILSPFFLILIVVIVGSQILISKPVLSFTPLKPDLKRLNPVEGFKKFVSIRILVELLKGLIKIGALVAATYWIVNHLSHMQLPHHLGAMQQISAAVRSELVHLGFIVLLLLVPTTLLDLIFTSKEFSKKMKMSKRERKDEHKKLEGSPEIRQKRKKIQRELLEKSKALSKVKTADLVVVNPTRLAVALKYDRNIQAAPLIVAMGRGAYAAQIRHQAQLHNISIYSRRRLAGQLLNLGRAGRPIPDSCYVSVASVYRKYFALKKAHADVE